MILRHGTLTVATTEDGTRETRLRRCDGEGAVLAEFELDEDEVRWLALFGAPEAWNRVAPPRDLRGGVEPSAPAVEQAAPSEPNPAPERPVAESGAEALDAQAMLPSLLDEPTAATPRKVR